MQGLTVTTNGTNIKLDEFFKSLLFQHIMDGEYSRNERDIMLVILRKTIHFGKWSDRVAMYWLATATGIGEVTLRETLKRLEAKGLLNIVKSKGGRTASQKKFNEFSFSDELLTFIFEKWYIIKDKKGFTPKVKFN